MSPPLEVWPASELPTRVQGDVYGRRRKPAAEQKGNLDLEKCELLEMVQFSCIVAGATDEERHRRDSRVVCEPLERWFRRCQDRNGSFLVETTAWEGTAKTKMAEESKIAQESKIPTDVQGPPSTIGRWWG